MSSRKLLKLNGTPESQPTAWGLNNYKYTIIFGIMSNSSKAWIERCKNDEFVEISVFDGFTGCLIFRHMKLRFVGNVHIFRTQVVLLETDFDFLLSTKDVITARELTWKYRLINIWRKFSKLDFSQYLTRFLLIVKLRARLI